MEPMRLPTAVIWELSCGLGKLADREYSSTLRRKHSSITNGMATAEMDGVVAWRAGELRGKHKASDSLSDLDGADS